MDGRSNPGLARLGAAAVLVLTSAGCWPAAGQGPDRTAHNPFETVITTRTVQTLEPVWTATTDSVTTGGVVGPPVVSTSGVHVSDSAAVTTFDKATGARRWSYPEPATFAGILADPLVDGDRVLVSGGTPVGFGGAWTAVAWWVDARTGAESPAPGLRTTARRGTLLAGYSAAGGAPAGYIVVALEVRDTAVPGAGWSATVRFGFDDFRVGLPATLGAQRLYYGGVASESYDPIVDVTGVRAYPLTTPDTCVLPPDGGPFGGLPCPLWATPTEGLPVTSPVLGPGESVLYVGLDDGTLLALDAADGHVLWSAALGAAPSADPALADGRIHVPLADGDLVTLPADGCGAPTCAVAWRSHLGGAGVQPAVAGGVVFVGTDAGQLVALRAAGCGRPTCHPLWQRDLGGPVTGAPAVSGGRVYVGVSPDTVVALAPTP